MPVMNIGRSCISHGSGLGPMTGISSRVGESNQRGSIHGFLTLSGLLQTERNVSLIQSRNTAASQWRT